MLTSLTVKLGAPKARFSAAVEQRSGKIRVAGIVRDNRPFLSEIGDFDVDVTLEVSWRQHLFCCAPPRIQSSIWQNGEPVAYRSAPAAFEPCVFGAHFTANICHCSLAC